MPEIHVKKTFVHNGQRIMPETVMQVPKHALKVIGDYAVVISPQEKLMKQNSSDFVSFCLAHENTYTDGHCPIKRDRVDPMSQCMGWRLKTGRKEVIV